MNDEYNAAIARRMWLEDRVIVFEQRAQTLLDEAKEAKHEVEICKAELHGIDLGLAARVPDTADCDEPDEPLTRNFTTEQSEARPGRLRRRRDVRGEVYEEIIRKPIGISEHDLAEKLGIRKTQVEAALEYHHRAGRIRENEAGGVWYAADPNSEPDDGREYEAEPEDNEPDAAAGAEFTLKEHPNA